VVAAPEQIRIQRVVDRDHSTAEKVKSIMHNQMSQEEVIKRSDYIITNDNLTLVIPQVLKLHQLFLNGAPVH
jgi:dephospho-CoA kinase